MIVCQRCGSSVRDGMRFCTECGAQISRAEDAPPTQRVRAAETGPRGGVSGDDEKTLVLETVPEFQGLPEAAPRFGAPGSHSPAPVIPLNAQPRSPRTAMTVGLTILATILLLALGAIGARYFFKNEEMNRNAISLAENRNAATPAPPQSNAASQPTTTPAVTTSQPSATTMPVDAATVVREVTQTLNDWAAATRAHDLDRHLSFYADTLDTYYGRTNVSAALVRADRSRAYTRFYKLDLQLGKIEVAPDATGQRATAAFDKTYEFEGDDKTMSGSVRQMVWLAKTGGRWRITGEKDLKVYYVNK